MVADFLEGQSAMLKKRVEQPDVSVECLTYHVLYNIMCRGWKPYSDAKVLIMYAKTLHTLENNVIFLEKL